MNIPTEKLERQKLAQNLLKNAGLFCDEVPELLENWILYTSPYNSNELYFLPMLEKLKENPDFVANQKVDFFVNISEDLLLMTEYSLPKIGQYFGGKHYTTVLYACDKIADEIEDTIEILQNTISYKVPLLLKPIFDIKNPDSIFLSCMQSGAYNKVSRTLIEIGVPRECALYLNNEFLKDYVVKDKSDTEIEEEIGLKVEKITFVRSYPYEKKGLLM